MKILIYSHYFAPSIGGVEFIVQSLASGLAKLRTLHGDREFDVIAITEVAAENFSDEAFPFQIVRQPGPLELWRLVRESDVLHAAGPALLPIFFGWLMRKRVVIEHHTYQSVCPNGMLPVFVHGGFKGISDKAADADVSAVPDGAGGNCESGSDQTCARSP